MFFLPWYSEGTREGRPLRGCLIIPVSFHSKAAGAKQKKNLSTETSF